MSESNKTITAQYINDLFIEIKARCPAWPQSWPNVEIEKKTRQIWLQELIKHKINNWGQIKKALEKITTSFVPTIDEFIKLCKPTMEDYGLPQPFEAFRECCLNASNMRYNIPTNWSHQAVYHAGIQTGLLEIEKLQDLFLANYEMACKIVFEGGRLRDLPKLIAEQPKQKASPEIALKSLADIKNILGISKKQS